MAIPTKNINAEKIKGNLSINGVSATTISATTYQNLPSSPNITGGTYFQGVTTFTNSTGGTFNITGPSNYNAGVISGATWSNNNNGSINLPQISVALFDNSDYIEPLRFYTISSGTTGVGGLPALTDNDTNYIIIEYNSGSPRYNVLNNSGTVNGSDILLYMIVYRIGNFVHTLEFGNQGAGMPNKINERILNTDRFARESGFELGLSGSTGVVEISAGVSWNGIYRQQLNAVNSVDDEFFKLFHSGGTWTYTLTGTTLNNTFYDDGTDVVSATTGNYLVNWYFRGQEIGNHIYEVYGNNEYTSISDAEASTEPMLPELITSHAFLVGRIIVGVGLTTGITQSAFSTVFQPSGAAGIHNDLLNIQGGAPNEYFHLSSNEYNNLAYTNVDNNFNVGQTFNGGLSATTVSATTYLGLPIDVFVTGGTYNDIIGVATFTNNSGGTFNVGGFNTGYTLTSSAITSALGYVPLSAFTDTFVTGGTYSNGTAVFTNNTGGTFNVVGFVTGDTYWISGSSGNFSIKANNDSGLDATGDYSVAEGSGSLATGANSHAEGQSTIAAGNHSHTEGDRTVANGEASHAEGFKTTADGIVAHSEGNSSYAKGDYSHAEGNATYSEATGSHAEGENTQAIGQGSHAEGGFSIANGTYSHAEGFETIAEAEYSHTEGYQTTTRSEYSHAEGLQTTVERNSDGAHAEGTLTIAAGRRAHAEGLQTTAQGNNSHSEGSITIAEGENSHAEGSSTQAIGINSHAEGDRSVAQGDNSHAEGSRTLASASTSHAEGNRSTASGTGSHAEGSATLASNTASHAEGSQTLAAGFSSHAEGNSTIASGDTSHAEGVLTNALGLISHAEGSATTASNTASHAQNFNTKATGIYSHAEGNNTTASGEGSHAEGSGTIASGAYSHAEGVSTRAIDRRAHAEGVLTTAGDTAHAEGSSTTASGQASHAEGSGSIASGTSSHAEGTSTIASNSSAHAEGYETTASGDASHAEGGRARAFGQYSHAQNLSTYAIGNYSHAEGDGTTAGGAGSHAGGSGSIASGVTSFIHSTNSIVTGNRSVVLGGQNITGNTADTVYVPRLNVKFLSGGTAVNTVGIDSNGFLVNDNEFDFSLNFIDDFTYPIILPYNWVVDTVDDPSSIGYDLSTTGGTYSLGSNLSAFTETLTVSAATSGFINLNCRRLG